MEFKANQTCSYIIQSQEDELKRMATDLHEGISQNLYSLATGLEVLQSGIKEPNMQTFAEELKAQLNRTIQEVNILSAELYPSTLAQLGLSSALKSYLKLFTSTFGVKIHVKLTGEEFVIPEPMSLAVFRSCQEALLNIAQHADIDEAAFHLTWESNLLKIAIIDNGKGFNLQEVTKNNKLKGIAAMNRRMKIAGGSCFIRSEKGEGTSVFIQLPNHSKKAIDGL